MARCNDCGAKGGHYKWCGVKYLDDDIESMGLSAVVADLRERHPEVEAKREVATSVPMFKFVPPAEDKPVWQQPSRAGSYNVISSPAHYARFAIQPIDFIEANGLDFLQASVLKYLVRFPFKNGVEDLHKARDMLNRLIKREEEKKERLAQVEDEADRACGLVRNTGQEVGREPAAEYAERGADRGGGAK